MHNAFFAKRIISLFLALAVILPTIALAQPLYYTVGNRTSGSLGIVTLSSATNGTNITVSGPGEYMTEVPGSITSVTINGYTSTYPATTDIVLPNGHPGRVTFTGTSRIEVIDLLDGV